MDLPLKLNRTKAPFDPLRRLALPSPQNTDVSALQNEARVRMFCDVLPNFRTLLTLEQSFVDLDFDEVSGLELLPNFLENRFAQPGLPNANAGSEIVGFCLTHDVRWNVGHLKPPFVAVDGAWGRHQNDECCRISGMF